MIQINATDKVLSSSLRAGMILSCVKLPFSILFNLLD